MLEKMYDRSASVAYAKQWAMGRNPAYHNFDGIGGDCTNFVSQCLYAGSGVMNEQYPFGWFYRSLWNRSPSWTGVEYLYRFLVENEGAGPYGRDVPLSELIAGDVIQLGDGEQFYHSLFVVKTFPEITIAAHTDDAYDRPLSAYQYGLARGIHIEGVRAW